MRNLPSTIHRRCSRKAALQAVAIMLLTVCLGPIGCQKATESGQARTPSQAGQPAAQATGAALPRLLDLGAGKCIPCKMMAPILEELKQEYAGAFEVVVIDVWQDRSAAEKHGIQSIPTQIFFDASGRELFRHEGFFSKEDILGKWKELGFHFKSNPKTP